MGVSDLKLDRNAGPVVDLSTRGLQKLDSSFTCSEDTHTLILDRNHIMKLDHLERSPSLQQLSVANNRLVRMMGVSRLTELRVLNLPNNSIGYIEGLRDLPHLTWLNLSGNNIKVIEQLNNCVSLKHLDLSDNNISALGDMNKLVALKTLLLHGNNITTLRTVPTHLPNHLSIFSLAENEIRDLNEVSYLASLLELEQLSIMSNPCVLATPSLPGFDYRPYIMSWCLNLKVLDGYIVSQKEGLRAEWLYSQGKGRSYRPGQHVQLVQYLATVCPLTSSPALETAEDAKLERILNKQRFHQRQLLEQAQANSPSPPRPTHLNVEKHSPSDVAQNEETRECNTASGPAVAPSVPETEPVVQFNTWVSVDSSHTPLPVVGSSRISEEHMCLEDVQTDEEKLQDTLLSSESTFLPVQSDLEPPTLQSDSEDETETFEPDSLAPKRPTQIKKHSLGKKHSSPLMEKQERNVVEDDATPGAAEIVASPLSRDSMQQDELEKSTDFYKAEVKETTKQEAQASTCVSKSADMERAAVKIQSWWKGHYTRFGHPVAREVRSEIRQRRMQEHILFLYEKLESVEKQYEEERLQRLVQEEAVKFLWKELQSMQEWKKSVEQQLANVTRSSALVQASPPQQCKASFPVASSTTDPPSSEVSFPDSGFQSTSGQQAVLEDSFLSSGTEESLKTVRTMSPVRSCVADGGDGGVDSSDCSLLEQYLSSVQQRDEEAEESCSDRTETPQLSAPVSPGKVEPQQKENKAQAQTEEDAVGPVRRLSPVFNA